MRKLFIILTLFCVSMGYAADTKTSDEGTKNNRKPSSEIESIELAPNLRATLYSGSSKSRSKDVWILEDNKNDVICYSYNTGDPSCVKR